MVKACLLKILNNFVVTDSNFLFSVDQDHSCAIEFQLSQDSREPRFVWLFEDVLGRQLITVKLY
jgi:hypothetical protein